MGHVAGSLWSTWLAFFMGQPISLWAGQWKADGQGTAAWSQAASGVSSARKPFSDMRRRRLGGGGDDGDGDGGHARLQHLKKLKM